LEVGTAEKVLKIRTLTGAGNDSLEVGTVQKLLMLTGAY